MRDYRTNYVVVGSFVLVMVVGLVVARAVLAGRTGATDTYYACFDDVTGVKFGTQVLYQGYGVGQVEAVEPRERLEEGPECTEGRRFRLELSVERGWTVDAEAQARITQAGFLSAMVVDIEGGKGEARLEPGSRIATEEQGDVLAAISGLSGDVSKLLDEVVRPLLEDLGRQVPPLLTRANSVTERLDATAMRLETLLAPENVQRVERVLENTENASGELASLTAELGETRRRLDRTMDTLTRLMEENEGEIDQAVADLGYTLESIARRIDVFTGNLESASRNLSEFTRQIRGNPSLLLRGGGGDEVAEPGE